MRSACLIPYCPFPVDTGARLIFNKHLKFLLDLGECSVLSAKMKPVGYGWSPEHENGLRNLGYSLHFVRHSAETFIPRAYGIGYALFFKALKMEKAFGHSNPYHRYAFDSEWLYQKTKSLDLCEIHYSYWARLETACPKVVIVHDLWSDIMWEGSGRETQELGRADLLVTVSHDDKVKLLERGLKNVHWSPPCIEEMGFDDSCDIVVVGSGNRHNIEGLEWLKAGLGTDCPARIHCYGAISRHVQDDVRFIAHGPYGDASEPYRQCGIVLMLTSGGTGLQIKGVEALAAGRAIIARKGAMRGLPNDQIGWIEVDGPEEMKDMMRTLSDYHELRNQLMERARRYYHRHLEKHNTIRLLNTKYTEICRQ